LAANFLTPDGALAASLAAPDMTLRMEILVFFFIFLL
jgi:hypothetical protein